MKVFRGLQAAALRDLHAGCALTIGNFDGVHRGHQAMIALLKNEAQHRGVKACALTFEPHPRDYFAAQVGKPELAPARISTLRDKLQELAACGLDAAVILPFNAKLAAMPAQDFVDEVLVHSMNDKYLLVGDDFRFGAKRLGDYDFLDRASRAANFDVARMNSYEVHGLRVSSSAVRESLAAGRMRDAAKLLGRAYSVSGHVVHGRKLGRELGKGPARPDGFPTLNLRFSSRHHLWQPAASGIFAVLVHGIGPTPLQGVANFGTRPSIDVNDVNGGRVLLETHVLDWPRALPLDHAYGKIIRVELLHKLHDELKYASLDLLMRGIEQDCADARAWFSQDTPLDALATAPAALL